MLTRLSDFSCIVCDPCTLFVFLYLYKCIDVCSHGLAGVGVLAASVAQGRIQLPRV